MITKVCYLQIYRILMMGNKSAEHSKRNWCTQIYVYHNFTILLSKYVRWSLYFMYPKYAFKRRSVVQDDNNRQQRFVFSLNDAIQSWRYNIIIQPVLHLKNGMFSVDMVVVIVEDTVNDTEKRRIDYCRIINNINQPQCVLKDESFFISLLN